MGLLDGLRARAVDLGRDLADSAQGALYLRQLLRGNSIRPHAHAPAAPSGPPVLLVHGYLATRGSLHLFERRLAERGFVVMTYRLSTALSAGLNLGDIRDSAALVARKVESLAEQTGVDHVDLCGHSMGGLCGLYYLKRLGGAARVRRLVLLGTPAQGTWSALLGLPMAALGRGSLQLLPGSAFLRDLDDGPLPAGPEVVSVSGERDWFAPPGSTLVPGARGLTLPTGHSGLLVDEASVDAVEGILRDPAPASEGDRARGGPGGPTLTPPSETNKIVRF